jgi:hypothetical protein
MVQTTGMTESLQAITVIAKDNFQNPLPSATVQASVTGANTATVNLQSFNNGTYTGSYEPTNTGEDQITATINATPLTQDNDGTSDGTFHISIDQGTASGDSGVHDYLATVAYDQTHDISHEIYFKPSVDVSGGEGNNKVIIQFPTDDSGLWCRVAGTDLNVTTDNLREPGATPLPGELWAECTQGDGATIGDRIIIHSVNDLTAGTVYGVKVSNDDDIIAKLGTPNDGSTGIGTIILNNGTEDVDEQDFQYGLTIDPDVYVHGYIVPTLSFSLSANDIGFGTMLPSAIRYATIDGAGSDILPAASEPVHIQASTNADEGLVVSVRSERQGLYSDGTEYTIGSVASTSVAAGTEGYGIFAKNADQFSIDPSYDNDGASDLPVTGSDTPLLTTAAPTIDATADLAAQIGITSTTPAGNYADTLTLTATGRY